MVGRGRNLSVLVAVILTAGMSIVAHASGGGGRVGYVDGRLDDRVVIRLHAGVSLGSFCAAFETNHPGLTLDPLDQIPTRTTHLLQLLPADLDEDLLDEIEEELEAGEVYASLLQWGEFSYEGQTAEGRTGSFWFSIENGDLFDSQFASGLLGLPAAHHYSRGEGVVVAVLDTGVDAGHPVLAGRLAPGGIDLVDDDDDPDDEGNGSDSDGDGNPDEMVGHGTFMASLIVLTAPQASILPVRVLDGDGKSSTWRVAKGLYAAVDAGAHVINTSLGTTCPSSVLADAVADARVRGVVVVAAVGNQATDQVPEFPAAAPSVLGVAALDDQDILAPFSNYGETVFLAAPGTRVVDPGFDLQRSVIGAMPGGGWAVWEGTSLSTAFVAGAAAVTRGLMSSATGDESTVDLVSLRLEWSAVDVTEQNPDFAGELGAGRLSAGGAARLGAGDLNGDGVIDVEDLEMLQDAWNWNCSDCLADLNGDGGVDFRDLVFLLSNWG